MSAENRVINVTKEKDIDISGIVNKYGFRLTFDDYVDIQRKYGSKDKNIVKEVKKALQEEYVKITKLAHTFANKILSRDSDKSLYSVLQKAQEIKAKNNLSDSAFDEFKKIYEQYLANKDVSSKYPKTVMSTLLGNPFEDSSQRLNIENDSDYTTLQEILKFNEELKPHHYNVIMQAHTYSDMDNETLTGEFDNKFHNIIEHIHPVVATLFLPKFKIIENYMLYANIAYIIKQKYEKEMLKTYPDVQLFYSLITNPNDIVYSNESALKDLQGRAMLQAALWESVLQLRLGKYYAPSSRNLKIALDKCKLSDMNNPLIAQAGHEEMLFKRLIDAFCIKTLIVSTTDITYNPAVVYNRAQYGGSHPTHHKFVSALSMVVVRLPAHKQLMTTDFIRLEDSLTQPHYYVENGVIVPKYQMVLYARELVMFFVPRRKYTHKYMHMIEPMIFNRLPKTVSGFEELNDIKVDFPVSLKIAEKIYYLRTIMTLNTIYNDITKSNMITGASTIALCSPNDSKLFDAVMYDPMSANKNLVGELPGPITTLPINSIDDEQSVMSIGQTCGTVFIYQDIEYK